MIGKAMMIVSLAASLAEGCEKRSNDGATPPLNEGPANVHCSVRADYPHQSHGTPTHIDGKVRVTCKGSAIDSLTIEARLERSKGGGKWEAAAPTSDPDPFAPAQEGKEYTKMSVFPCSEIQPGDKFRTGGRASGMFAGKPAGSATWINNPERGFKSNVDDLLRRAGQQRPARLGDDTGLVRPVGDGERRTYRPSGKARRVRRCGRVDSRPVASRNGRGSVIKVVILEPDAALLIVADATFPASWYLTDTPEDPGTFENIVLKIMDNDIMLAVRLDLADTAKLVAGGGMRLSAWSQN